MDLNLLMIFLTLSKTDLRGMQHIPHVQIRTKHMWSTMIDRRSFRPQSHNRDFCHNCLFQSRNSRGIYFVLCTRARARAMILIYIYREREIVTTLVKYMTSENETSEGNKKKR